MIKQFSHTAWPQVWSLDTSLFFTQARRGWGEILLDIYTDIQFFAWQHSRFLIPHFLHAGMPRQTCSCLAALHLCGHDWRTTGNPPPTLPAFPERWRPCVFIVCFIFFSLRLGYGFFSASWNLVLNGNSPDCLPVVVGKGWQWLGLKCYQMMCGGVNPDVFFLLYSFLPTCFRSSEEKWNKINWHTLTSY